MRAARALGAAAVVLCLPVVSAFGKKSRNLDPPDVRVLYLGSDRTLNLDRNIPSRKGKPRYHVEIFQELGGGGGAVVNWKRKRKDRTDGSVTYKAKARKSGNLIWGDLHVEFDAENRVTSFLLHMRARRSDYLTNLDWGFHPVTPNQKTWGTTVAGASVISITPLAND